MPGHQEQYLACTTGTSEHHYTQKCARTTQHVQLVEARTPTEAKTDAETQDRLENILIF